MDYETLNYSILSYKLEQKIAASDTFSKNDLFVIDVDYETP